MKLWSIRNLCPVTACFIQFLLPAAAPAEQSQAQNLHVQYLQSHTATTFGSLSIQDSNQELKKFIQQQDRQGSKTLAFLVVKNGVVTDEYYADKYTFETPSVLFSASKSITGLAIGAAFEEYNLDLDSSICAWISPGSSSISEFNTCQVTVRDALGMASGIKWKESYLASNPESDVLRMLYGPGALDMSRYVADLTLEYAPGSHFNYSSGDTMLLSRILKEVTGNNSKAFVKRKLFDTLGIRNAIWEQDLSGTLVGAASLYLSAKDMVAVGKMLLAKGEGPNGRVVSENYLNASITPFAKSRTARFEDSFDLERQHEAHKEAYGYHWWLNSSGDADHPALRFPNATPLTFSALGFWGQYLTVIPEERTLVIRFGQDKGAPFDMNAAIGLVRKVRAKAQTHEYENNLQEFTHLAASPENVGIPLESIDLALGFTAKNYCSCRLISQQSDRSCKRFATLPGLPPITFKQTKRSGTVRVESQILGRGKYAVFTKEMGCVLTSSESHKTLDPNLNSEQNF